MFEFNKKIASTILNHLQGWRLETNEETLGDGSQTVEVSPFLNEYDYSTLQSSKTISYNELEEFFNLACVSTESYIGRDLNEVELSADNFVVESAVCMWAAGLVWKKYNLRVVDEEDDTNTTGYGDGLIISAKSMLKPYRYYNLSIFH